MKENISQRLNQRSIFADRLIDKDALAGYLGLKRRGVECLMAKRRIPYIRVGGRIRFQLSKVLKALERFEVKPAGDK